MIRKACAVIAAVWLTTITGCVGGSSPDGQASEAVKILEQMTARLDGVRTGKDAYSAARDLKVSAQQVRKVLTELRADQSGYDAEAYAQAMHRIRGAMRLFRSQLHHATLLNSDVLPHLAVVEQRLGPTP